MRPVRPRRHRVASRIAVAIVAAGCATGCPPDHHAKPPPVPTPKPVDAEHPDLAVLRADARAGVSDEELGQLLVAHWETTMRESPLWATRLGIHAFDDRLADNSEEGVARWRAFRREVLERAERIDPERLSPADRVTLALLTEELENGVAQEVCEEHLWSLSARDNPVTEWNNLPEVHLVTTPAEGEALLSRYGAIAGSIDNMVANLRSGAKRGLYATAESTRRVLDMVDKQLAQPLDEWPLMQPANVPHDDWDEPTLEEFRLQLRATVERSIQPALRRYGDLLRNELLPNARAEADSGLVALPLGKACYAARVHRYTTLDLPPDAIHQIGLEQIALTDAELARLGEQALETADLPATLAKLRSDPSLHFDSEEEVEQAAKDALAEAKAKMGDHFGVLPQADCVVRRVPEYEAPYTTIAYYQPPFVDGSKPGEYFINVFEPKTRPRYEARVLAVHEAIPGHHLQIAISQELGAIPAFRKHGGFTAFVEGWALYTERLAGTMGLYRDDLDRIGVASFDAWRGGRLVVDTGIHAFGWSRSKARAYLEEHTALSPKNIDNEVDRYISWPGQALAYKLGQLEILSLRQQAEIELGDAFDEKAFHDALLSAGAVTLPVLRQRIEAHIATRHGAD